ncbi:hypothetical protein CK203_098976 [Vitis vinifera]|uniref:DUF659 domain-containing protein n=1 Tax=Vitis vinifera TaxID=29760 RepID=A0A438CH81_VITVI|nr:hypothetical protein CK203_098976 [Vitis vinifera]
MKQAMKESRRIFEEGGQENQKGADSGPYYQSMIDTIAEAGPGIKGPTRYQIGNTYLEEEVQELESSRTRKPIINFMIYCDRSMIYHSSVDTTNIPKTADYIFSLMDKVVEEVGEENVVQVVTDNEASFKATGEVQTIMEPLVKVLKLVDQDKNPTLSIIYEAMDRAKLAIKASVKQWEKYWEVIDHRWEGQLHRHLHAAVGLKEVIKRLEPDLDRQAKAINEVKLFVDSQGEFGSALTKKAINQSLSDEWIREGEEPILSSDNLDWLDKGFPTNEEGKERDVDSRRKGVGGTSEGTRRNGSTGSSYVSQVDPNMSWAQRGENYYATQDTDHGYQPGIWEQRKHLERLTTFPSDDDYHRSNYHRINEHLQNLGIGSRPYFREVDDRSYHNFRDRDSSSSTFSRTDFNQFPMMHPEEYSNTRTRASDSYGYDQSSSSSSIAYRGFGYYQSGVDPK